MEVIPNLEAEGEETPKKGSYHLYIKRASVFQKDLLQMAVQDYEGFTNGLISFSQLIEEDQEDGTFYIPNTPIEIHDSPDYEYRGYMLDVSRHFFPLT